MKPEKKNICTRWYWVVLAGFVGGSRWFWLVLGRLGWPVPFLRNHDFQRLKLRRKITVVVTYFSLLFYFLCSCYPTLFRKPSLSKCWNTINWVYLMHLRRHQRWKWNLTKLKQTPRLKLCEMTMGIKAIQSAALPLLCHSSKTSLLLHRP